MCRSRQTDSAQPRPAAQHATLPVHRLTHAPAPNSPDLRSEISTPPFLPAPSPGSSDGAAALAGGYAAAGHHRWHALHHGQRPVLHPQGRARQGALRSYPSRSYTPGFRPVLTLGSLRFLCGCSRSTSGTTCGTSPWSAATRSSSSGRPATRCGSCPCSSCVGLFLVFDLRGCVAARNDPGS
jgi:hypothetical protein